MNLKKIATTPKFLRPILGNTWLDEVGTVAGMATGNPALAAAGRGAGKLAYTGDVTKGLVGAAEGYAMGLGADAVGGAVKGAGGWRAALANPGKVGGSLVRSARGVGARGGTTGNPVDLTEEELGGNPAGALGQRGILDRVFDYIKKNPQVAIAGMGMLSNGRQQQRQNQMSKEGLRILRERSQGDAATRRAMIEAMQGGLYGGGGGHGYDLGAAYNTGSVYDQPLRALPVGAR